MSSEELRQNKQTHLAGNAMRAFCKALLEQGLNCIPETQLGRIANRNNKSIRYWFQHLGVPEKKVRQATPEEAEQIKKMIRGGRNLTYIQKLIDLPIKEINKISNEVLQEEETEMNMAQFTKKMDHMAQLRDFENALREEMKRRDKNFITANGF